MEQTRICPYCKKEIHRLATKCPFCQSMVKPVFTKDEKRKQRRPVLIGVGAVIALIILLSIEISITSNSENSTNSIPVATPTNEQNGIWVSASAASQKNYSAKNNQSSNDQDTSYTKTTITDLLASSSPVALAEVSGQITQRIKYNYIDPNSKIDSVAYYLKITDSSGSIALVYFKDNELGQYAVGDVVDVQAVTGNDGSCTSDADAIRNCALLKIPSNTPYLIPISTNGITITDRSSAQPSISVTQITDNVPLSAKSLPPPSLSIGITYDAVMSGLEPFFDMQNFSNSQNSGYQGKTTSNAVLDLFLADDKITLSTIDLSFFDPNIGYDPSLVTYPSDYTQQRSENAQILGIFTANVLSDWPSAAAWITNSLQSCEENGQEITYVDGIKQISLSCSTSLGSFAIEIDHT